ncbi:peptidase S8/S53 domain-containing protein [Thamnocephalis sphaerospora]|uniref:Peptidase S8/S53 domain-containing protein n=1 Tax=Thamnocephalis sphaerospora TaxID=78915 RepID=A0A4P9XX70_9FUNG|nr:peptidase S8/S53 domain-containing protein [Thamnocephalis sphaerospora]|eukprot:RKP10271.1 peptidase S8/S53 domain-containing protein [Thamnocephalis sphaerospora]
MRFSLKLLLLAATVVLTAASHASAQTTQSNVITETRSEVVGDAFVVELENKVKQESLFSGLQKAGIPYTVRISFSTLFKGVSLQTDAQNVQRISKVPGVRKVWPLWSIIRPSARVSVTGSRLDVIHDMTGVKEVQQRYKYDGRGIKVGVIDSGIDYTHPALGGCFGPGCRVAFGYDFVGDNYRGPSTRKPDPDPRDTCNGHGTHVAGIIGANSADMMGIAPAATLGAYRVMGCYGSTASDVMIAAMEQAYLDGMDVINMSILSNTAWADTPDGLVANRLSELGVLIAAAAGNSGRIGMWATTAPGLADGVLSVTSIDSVKYYATVFTLSSDSDEVFEYIDTQPGRRLNFTEVQIALARSVSKPSNDLACTELVGGYTGKIVVAQRGSCSMDAKARIAQRAGAVAIVVYNNVNETFSPIVDDPRAIPTVGIQLDDARVLLSAINAGSAVNATFSEELRLTTNPNGNLISDFSSWGPGPLLEMKPDLAAPGGQIYSTWPLTMGNGYAITSGTSMAAPYMAGSIALYLQAHGKRNATPNRIRQAFQNAAKPVRSGTSIRGRQPTSVLRQGAGMVDVMQAITGSTSVLPSRLALNDTDHAAGGIFSYPGSPIVRTITVTNNGKASKMYSMMHIPTASALGFDARGSITANPKLSRSVATVRFMPSRFIVLPGRSQAVTVTITPPQWLPAGEKWLYSGYVVANPHEAVHVPYMGMKGSLHNVRIFSTATGYPFLQSAQDGSRVSRPNEKVTYTFKGNDFPWIHVRIEYPTRLFFIRILDAKGKRVLGLVPDSTTELITRTDWTPENSELGMAWDGTIQTTMSNRTVSALPNGRYHLQLVALLPFGKPDKESDFDVWRSPLISVARS